MVWCARCRRRLIIMRGKSHNGSLYFYWLCRGRQQHTCNLPYLPVEQVEDEVIRHYATVRLPDDLRVTIQAQIEAAVADRHGTQTRIRTQLTKRLADLEKQEDAYLDLVGHPDWPQDKLSAKMRQLAQQKTSVQNQLATADVDLTAGQTIIRELCDLLTDPKTLYQRASKRARRTLNKAIFTRLYIDADQDNRPVVASDHLTEHVEPLVHATRHRHTHTNPPSKVEQTDHNDEVTQALTEEGLTLRELSLTELAERAFGSDCSSKTLTVGGTGIEPVTSSV
ncbi:MAG: zinc ribbon domain-containing protein [Natronosporangium sp.]